MNKTTLQKMKIDSHSSFRFSTLKYVVIFLCTVFTSQISTAQTFPNPTTLSTGQGAIGATDPLWLASPWYLTSPPNPMGLAYIATTINNSCAPGAWVDPTTLAPPMNNGNWITGSDGTCAANTNVGYRYFRLTLDLPADCNGFSVTVANSYVLDLIGYADNSISNVFINGNPTGISGGGFGPSNQLNIHLVGPWAVGTNYVDVLIYNTPGPVTNPPGTNPYGLFLVADATTSSTIDTDGDGITNNLDLCPCTAGANPFGCSDPAINNCDIDAIRTAFLNAGCIELPQCTSGCSMYFLNPTSLSGSQAQSFAQNLGANLISVQSAAENQCMLDELVRLGESGVIWIGLNDETVEGSFVWYDQSPVTYSNWSPGEPNNSGNEDCVQIYPGGANPGMWNDLSCSSNNAKSIIEVNLCPIINAGTDQTICAGATANLLSTSTILGSNPYTYTWSNGVTTLSNPVSPLVTDTFSIVTVDRYSCTMSDTVIVKVNPLPTVDAGSDIVICPEETATLSGSGATTYVWTNGITDGVAFVPNTSVNEFVVTGTDANNCQQTDTVIVTVELEGCPNFPNDFTCDIDAIRTAFTAAGCVEMVSCVSECSLYFLNQQSLSGSDAQLFAQNLGSNLVSIQSQAENDCIVSSLVNLGLNSASDVIWIGLNDETTEGTFVWYDQAPVNYSNWALGEPNNNGSGEDCVQIYPDGKWNDLPCGIGNAKSVIEVNLCPVINAGADRIICLGETVNLAASNTVSGSNPYTYSWNNGAQTQNTTVSPSQTGDFIITSTDRYDCTTKDTLQITVNPLPNVAFNTNNVCIGTIATFTNQSTISSGTNNQWNWVFGDGNVANTANTTNNYSTAGTYSVTLTVTSLAGCKDSVTNPITVYTIPVNPIISNNSPVECPGDLVSITANSIAGASYFWSGPQNFTSDQMGFTFPAEFGKQGSYDLYVTVNGCPSGIESTLVKILGSFDPITQEFPNVITPNKDGVNDFLDIEQYFTSCLKYKIIIWNRWGNIVYEQATGEKPFEGKDRSGADLSDGVYFYQLTYGEEQTTGTVTIVR